MIVHEAAKTAGFGAEIAARLAEGSDVDLLAPVERVTGYDTHMPLFRLEKKYLPSVDRIVAAARRAWRSPDEQPTHGMPAKAEIQSGRSYLARS